MKTLSMFAVFALVAMSLGAVSAGAGEIAVYFGSEMGSSMQVKPFVPFDIQIVVQNIDDSINAVEYKLNLPAEVVVQDENYWNGTTLVIGGPQAAVGTAIALGECVQMFEGSGLPTSIVVATLQAITVDTFSESAVTLTEFTGTPSNPGTAPRYSSCGSVITNLSPVDGTLEGVTVPTTATSFSKVKSLF